MLSTVASMFLFVHFVALVSLFYVNADVLLDTIIMPPGFDIEVIANRSQFHVNQPRQLNVQFYENATIIYIATINSKFKKVIALIDRESDNIIDESFIIYSPSNPNDTYAIMSLAIHPLTGQLFLAQPTAILSCDGNANDLILNKFNSTSRLTCNKMFHCPYQNTDFHSLHYMRFNPISNELCIAFGQPCNECINQTLTPPFSSIICYDVYKNTPKSILNGTIKVYGIRNSVGIDFHPQTNMMWFTDNGRDDLLSVTNMPDDELNVVISDGDFYGYPWCHSEGCGNPYQREIKCITSITDPSLGDGGFTNNCTSNFTLPIQAMGPHVAVLAMKFYNYSMFPIQYQNGNAIFISQHGSYDRMPMIGYRIATIFINKTNNYTNIIQHDIFAQGWLNDTTQSNWGRVTDIDYLKDGSMIVADDQANVIYRISYNSTKDTIDAQKKYKKIKQQLTNNYNQAVNRANES